MSQAAIRTLTALWRSCLLQAVCVLCSLSAEHVYNAGGDLESLVLRAYDHKQKDLSPEVLWDELLSTDLSAVVTDILQVACTRVCCSVCRYGVVLHASVCVSGRADACI